MKRKARFLCIFLVTAMLLSLIAGCTGSKDSDSEKASSVETKEEAPVDISWVGLTADGFYPEDDSYVSQEINKMFNVKIHLQPTAYNDIQKLGMMYASGIIPDHNQVTSGYFENFYGQGLYREIPMDMLKKYAPEVYKRSAALLDYDNLPTMVDGKLYGIPHPFKNPPNLAVIRTDWLQKVGAKVPSTLEEFENVAKLFTENDPDGNGKKDTYMLGWGPAWAGNLQFILWAHGLSNDFLLGGGGKLQYKETSENYKKYVKYVANLYKKGYIYPDLTQTKADNVKNFFTNGSVGFTMDTWTWFMTKYRPSAYYALTFQKFPDAKTEYMKPLKTPEGKESPIGAVNPIFGYSCIGRNTTDAQLIKILQILDKQQTDLTFHNLIWRGREGEHYTVDENGMAVYTEKYKTLESQTKSGLKVFIYNCKQGQEMTLSFGREADTQLEFVAKNYQPETRPFISFGTFNPVSKDYETDINKIRDEFFMKAISGSLNVDAEWDGYVDRMKKAGLDKVMEEWDKLYEKQKQKK